MDNNKTESSQIYIDRLKTFIESKRETIGFINLKAKKDLNLKLGLNKAFQVQGLKVINHMTEP